MVRAGEQNAVTAFGAEDEAAFHERRKDQNRAGAAQIAPRIAEDRVMTQRGHGGVGVGEQIARIRGLRRYGEKRNSDGRCGGELGKCLHGQSLKVPL
jgi:hypothetical protein